MSKEAIESILLKFKKQRDGGQSYRTADEKFGFAETYIVTLKHDERDLVEKLIRQALQIREGITSDFPLIDPNQFAVYLSTMKAGEVITEKMIERLNGYMEIVTQQYEWPESCENMVLVPIEPTEEIIDAMEEMFMPFGEMRAAYDGVVMAALKPSSRGEQ